MTAYFPNSEGLVSFVKEIDKLKAEGVVTSFSFANEELVKDKTGAFGLPVDFEMTGNWEQVGSTIQRILSLPYLVRAILFEAQTNPEDVNILQVKFGGFLYVDKTFIKNNESNEIIQNARAIEKIVSERSTISRK